MIMNPVTMFEEIPLTIAFEVSDIKLTGESPLPLPVTNCPICFRAGIRGMLYSFSHCQFSLQEGIDPGEFIMEVHLYPVGAVADPLMNIPLCRSPLILREVTDYHFFC